MYGSITRRGRGRGRGRAIMADKPPYLLTEDELCAQAVTKVVDALKATFLKRDDTPQDVYKILTSVEATLSEKLRTKIVDQLLWKHPRVEFTEGKVSYVPPLAINHAQGLLKIVEERSKEGKGVSECEVLDSEPCAASFIKQLEEAGQIITVKRSDGMRALFCLTEKDGDGSATATTANGIDDIKLSDFKVDENFKRAFHEVNTTQLHIVDIEKYLKKNRLNPMETCKKKCNGHHKFKR